MPKFNVCLGRLVRETSTVIVEAPNLKSLEARLNEVYENYDGPWEEDSEWGCDESDSHVVLGEVKSQRAKALITFK